MESNAFAEFWRQLPPGGKIHPADRPILDAEKHSLKFENLPAFGAGPLATAPVVLCYLNNRPLYKLPACDREFIINQEEKLKATWGEYLAGIIEGTRDPRPLTEWGRERTKGLKPELEAATLKPKLEAATFNIVPYRSSEFKGRTRQLAYYLPSSRMARNYLHDVLLPAAARGERFIVIVWGRVLWGVHPALSHATLSVPKGYIGGFLSEDLKDRIKAWWAGHDGD
jgi:hypothetical protein